MTVCGKTRVLTQRGYLQVPELTKEDLIGCGYVHNRTNRAILHAEDLALMLRRDGSQTQRITQSAPGGTAKILGEDKATYDHELECVDKTGRPLPGLLLLPSDSLREALPLAFPPVRFQKGKPRHMPIPPVRDITLLTLALKIAGYDPEQVFVEDLEGKSRPYWRIREDPRNPLGWGWVFWERPVRAYSYGTHQDRHEYVAVHSMVPVEINGVKTLCPEGVEE